LLAQFCLCVISCGLGGCGNSSGLAHLSGTVFVDTQPAQAGLQLEFIPQQKGLVPAYATTGDGGQYVAQFSFREDGIQPGNYIVRLVPGSGGADGANGDVNQTPKPGENTGELSRKSVNSQFPAQAYQELARIDVPRSGLRYDIEITTSSKK
jgi:hypothetical protein